MTALAPRVDPLDAAHPLDAARPLEPGVVDHDPLEVRERAVQAFFDQPRFAATVRLHTAREVAEQQGTIPVDHPVARDTAVAFHHRLRALFASGGHMTTFGPYTPGQAVTQKRLGLEGIYLGGWATSAKGSMHEDPGPDLASYPLSSVPDEAAGIVRALLTADRNQAFARGRMSAAERRSTPEADYRPFIIADADTGHGGDAHVRNLIRRFVEVGVPGYHIEDQRAGAKKCGHQDGKVLVTQAEQHKRLNAARLQLDIMGVPGLIVARTDAESATLIDDIGDERDQPYVLGATVPGLPTFRVGSIALLARLHDLGLASVQGHRLFAISPSDRADADAWLDRQGIAAWLRDEVAAMPDRADHAAVDALLDAADHRYASAWEAAAGVMTYGDAVAAALATRSDQGVDDPTVAAWHAFAATAATTDARRRAAELGVEIHWDPTAPRTMDGFYRVRGGVDYATARSIAAAPFADLLWMETKTADLADARRFADAVHAVHPDAMLAYNLSPSFNWDTTGMTDEEMRRFPDELGRLGFVFDFITYGGHQVDGQATEEFVTALRDDGMLALARLQRRLRLLGSPYRTPQTLVGGNRADAALMAASGRTAGTRAMGARSTQHQHLAETEPAPAVLERWLAAAHRDGPTPAVSLRPRFGGSDGLRLTLTCPRHRRLVVDYTPLGGEDRTVVLEAIDRPDGAGDLDDLGLALLFVLHRERAGSLLSLRDLTVDAVRALATAGLAVAGPGADTGPGLAFDRASVVAAASQAASRGAALEK